MANTLQIKRHATYSTDADPGATGALAYGELGWNNQGKKLWIGRQTGAGPEVITSYQLNPDASTTVKGLASFDSNDFSSYVGAISIKAGGVSNTQLANNSISVGHNLASADAVALGSTIVIQGTANEVTSSASSGTVTLGLPDDVTLGGDLVVTGDLTVNGDTVTANVATITVEDKTIELGKAGTPTNTTANGSGIFVEGVGLKSILYSSTGDKWVSNKAFGCTDLIASGNVSGTWTGVDMAASNLATDSVGSTQIAANAVGSSEVASSAIGATQLAVVGDGTTSQFLRSDGDGTFTWAAPAGGVASISVSDGLDSTGGASPDLSVDFEELNDSGTLITTDKLVSVDGTATTKSVISAIPLSIFNNDNGWTSNVGDITSVGAGTGLSGGGTSGGLTMSLDLSELTSSNPPVTGDKLVFIDNGVNASFEFSDLPLSIFNNDNSWTSNVGDITAVTAGTGMTGGGTSAGVTLNVIGGTGITANANDIAIDSTVITTSSTIDGGTVAWS